MNLITFWGQSSGTQNWPKTRCLEHLSRRYIDYIISSGDRAMLIIDQILTLSRKQERVIKPFSVSELVTEIAPLLRMALPPTIELSFRFDQMQA
nr:hypothetical protein K4M19_00133 [Agrobacterium fabrum]